MYDAVLRSHRRLSLGNQLVGESCRLGNAIPRTCRERYLDGRRERKAVADADVDRFHLIARTEGHADALAVVFERCG